MTVSRMSVGRFFKGLEQAIVAIKNLEDVGRELFGKPGDTEPPPEDAPPQEPLRVEPVEVREVRR